MIFYIAPVSKDILEYSNAEDYFTGPDGVAYGYTVEYMEDEMISITDSVGRYVPLDIDEVAHLYAMLGRIVRHHNGKQEAEHYLMSKLLNGSN